MNPLLIGGEMPHWSDAGPAGGPVLRELAAAARGHTLIVGPHEPEVIDAVAARHVTVLVRGVPDAESLAARYASRPGFEVCCGSLEKLAAVPAYDTVLALDGLDRAASTETGPLTWASGLATLLAVLRPGGQLLLGADNPVGLHRLLACAPEPGDAEWDGPAPDGPHDVADLEARLRSAGLEVLRSYSAFPSTRAPEVLLSPAALSDPELAGYLSVVLRRAWTGKLPMLAEPGPVAAKLLRHGLAGSLTPGWMVVAGHGAPALPDGLVRAGDSVRRLSRDAERPPAGQCLHDLLIAAVQARDTPRLRSLLHAWQSDAAGVVADAVVVDAAGRLHGLAAPGDHEAALRRFAAAVHDEGPAGTEAAELVGAVAGVTADPARPHARGLREVAAARDRLARELSELRAQVDWYEQRLATRDAELARAYRIISLLRGTALGRAVTALRTGKRAARSALHRLRPDR